MNYLDLILILPLVYGAIRGFAKGFIIEVASLASLIVGVFIAVLLSDIIGEIAESIIDWNPIIVKIVVFAVALTLVIFIVHLIAKSLEKIVKIAGLGIFNRIAGLVAGFLKMAFFVSVILILLNNINLTAGKKVISDENRENSLLYNRLENFAHFVLPDKDFLQRYNIFSFKNESTGSD
ncbi:MAG: CvpA family protein [Bacteroidetes bacterium]|nr:CvpA family protein [Bacteroidota bacterium]